MTAAKAVALARPVVPGATRIYVAGPMTGYPALTFPAFHGAAAALRVQGQHVENPAEINASPTTGWTGWLDCMRADIARLGELRCAVHAARQRSRGASIGHGLAQGSWAGRSSTPPKESPMALKPTKPSRQQRNQRKAERRRQRKPDDSQPRPA